MSHATEGDVSSADRTLERAIQRDVIRVYVSFGCTVRATSPGRRGGTRNAPGLPDLIVFPPLRAWPPLPFFHETKTLLGTLSAAQVAWKRDCEARGMACIVGGTEAALIHLRAIRLIANPCRTA